MSTAMGISVTVGAIQVHCSVVRTHSATLVFIHIPSEVPLAAARGAKGWLQGIAPRNGDVAVFDGATSAVTTTSCSHGKRIRE